MYQSSELLRLDLDGGEILFLRESRHGQRTHGAASRDAELVREHANPPKLVYRRRMRHHIAAAAGGTSAPHPNLGIALK